MTIKIGIVGARGLSTIKGFQANPDTEVVALCDLDEQLLLTESQKHGISLTYRIYDDMLDSDIDAVVVSTPMQLHVPQTIQALEAGKHVLCEVTAGVTMDELWWLKEAVEKYGKVYMMAENYCYIPQNQLIRNMVERGLFGEVYFGEGEYIHDIKKLAYGYNRTDVRSDTNLKTSWRSYWQLGKRGAFYPTHSLGPVMQCFGATESNQFHAWVQVGIRHRNSGKKTPLLHCARWKAGSLSKSVSIAFRRGRII